MRKYCFKIIIIFVGVIGLAMFTTGCASWVGCGSWITYDPHVKSVRNLSQNVPCYGEVTYADYHGMVHFGVNGTYWDFDGYGIYFKKPTNSSNDFYFTMDRTNERTNSAVVLVEAKGVVQLINTNHILIDIEYRDQNGKWKKPPINGKHEIDFCY